MAGAELKLVSEKPVTDDPLFFERRHDPRRRACGQVTAVLERAAGEGTLRRICSLQLVDMSEHGVGVWSDAALPESASVTLYVPAHGPDGGFDLIKGTVVRSVVLESGFRVGIQTSPYQTAAA